MPTYEYLCDEGHEFQTMQSIHDDAITECLMSTDESPSFYSSTATQCGAPCHRQISAVGFKFKGGAPTPKFHA